MAEARTVRLSIADGIEIWWDRADPTRILHTTHDSRFRDDAGGSPGLWWTACSNPDSADYHPTNFNRLRRAFLAEELDAPPECPPGERRLRSRMPG
jgi:hypothetical protein